MTPAMQIGSSGGPVGAVMAYAGLLDTPQRVTTLAAQGWLLCDGSELAIAQYPQLFAAIGYLYGGYGEQFRLPDYRGYFLRGVDAGRGVDPDAYLRASPGDGRPEEVGSTQRSALQDHAHRYAQFQQAEMVAGNQMVVPGVMGITEAVTDKPVGIGGAPFQVSEGETRPVNAYVHYIIRFTHPIG